MTAVFNLRTLTLGLPSERRVLGFERYFPQLIEMTAPGADEIHADVLVLAEGLEGTVAKVALGGALAVQLCGVDCQLFAELERALSECFNLVELGASASMDTQGAGIGRTCQLPLQRIEACFLRKPDSLPSLPSGDLLKLALLSLAQGQVGVALRCLEHLPDDDLSLSGRPEIELLKSLKRLAAELPHLPVAPVSAHLPPAERDQLNRRYFDDVDPLQFRHWMPLLLDVRPNRIETLLAEYGLEPLSRQLTETRLQQAASTVSNLGMGEQVGQGYRLWIERELQRLGLVQDMRVFTRSAPAIQAEADRLSKLSGWEGGPAEGWQYPFDLGHGIVTRTYTEVQQVLHPWRKQVLLSNLDTLFAGRYDQISVLDLGACEGSMALALWEERGVRDITCVEGRAINVDKARFVFDVKKAEIAVVHDDITHFLQCDTRQYDLVLFMGILYHLLEPFQMLRLVAQKVRGHLAMETVLALPRTEGFYNVPHYSPNNEGFYVRHDSVLSNTAGFRNLELWPNRGGLEVLLKETGFDMIRQMDYGTEPIDWYASEQRIMMLADRAC